MAWAIEEGESQWGGQGRYGGNCGMDNGGGEGQSTESIVEVNLVFLHHQSQNYELLTKSEAIYTIRSQMSQRCKRNVLSHQKVQTKCTTFLTALPIKLISTSGIFCPRQWCLVCHG